MTGHFTFFGLAESRQSAIRTKSPYSFAVHRFLSFASLLPS